MSAIPYITSWVFGIAFGNIADVLLRRKYVSILKIRKTAQLVGKKETCYLKVGNLLLSGLPRLIMCE